MSLRRLLPLGPILLALVCNGCPAAADPAPAFAPTGSFELVPRDGGYVIDAQTSGADYLYLLRVGEEGVQVLYPPNGDVWMAAEGGRETVVPQPPSAQPDDDPLPTWSPGAGPPPGLILVATPTPRDTAPSQSFTLETFLAGPPYVTGPVAAPGVVLDREGG